jgi:aryl-alcohol dehydrogenase-like predicted oxidoreductase
MTKATTMRARPLGRTGLEVSELALGTWAFGGDEWGPARDDDAIALIRAAVDAGVTLVDAADVYGYGRAEEVVRRALAGIRADHVLVCSKAGNDVLDTARVPGGGPKRFDAGYLRRALA